NKFSEVACSILTSDFEGFGRVVTVILYAGTPFVSYDTNYATSYIVRSNIDGYIVEKGNKQELDNSIIEIYEDMNLYNRLSKRANEVKERFNFEKFEENWQHLLKNI